MNFICGKEGVKTVDQTRVATVAVVGMQCRLPRGTDSPEPLWEALLGGDDLITEVSPDRWDITDFDPEFFGIAFCGVSSGVLTSKALLSKCPDSISGFMGAPLTTIRGSRISSGYLTNRDVLRGLEEKWSE
jgi:hypothetical protein